MKHWIIRATVLVQLFFIIFRQLQNPYSTDPPFRFGTIPAGNTQAILKNYKPHLYNYMKRFNRTSSVKGIAAVKKG